MSERANEFDDIDASIIQDAGTLAEPPKINSEPLVI
jgi:hypothetical protein